ncbi:MAG: Asp-tRNA(Asn)/Glu-tRNA(Gln) amidotransferase subunit GatC [Gemmatimonadota bacterium]|nr:MAG: Asp-tRNA(Asn)/Glu-tRNA(Gln) amidotransferase subunit GatC [Gemmatimonadota bacterium]
MTIKREDVAKVAELARLELGDDELEALSRDCRSILEFFEAIRDVDVKGATPTGALEHPAPAREDRVDHDHLERQPAEMAPDWREGYFVLPRLPALDGGDDAADGEA